MTARPPDFLKLLAHDIRWALLAALARSDRRVQELVALLDRPANLVSYHLRRLRALGLVHERRSAADARDVYYTLDLARVRELYRAAGEGLHPMLNAATPQAQQGVAGGRPRPARVLFLCTENSARSQMAEGLLRALGGDRVAAFSAGSAPATVHPLAVRAMAAAGVDIRSQRSKHLDEFRGRRFDYIITVCDRVREVCPVFPGDPERIHWSCADPAAAAGSETARYRAFQQAARELTARVQHLLATIASEVPIKKQVSP